MTERTTHEVKTPLGKTAVVKDYLTGREVNELRTVMVERIQVDKDNVQPSINGELLIRGERKLLELAIVSYDGNSENVADRILDERNEESVFLKAEAEKVAGFTKAN